MDNNRVEQIIVRARHTVTQAIVKSNVSRNLTIDDLEIILTALEDSLLSIAVSVTEELPARSPLNELKCQGNIVIGYHYVDNIKKHIMQVTELDGSVRYYTNGKLEMVKHSKHGRNGSTPVDAGE
jgi:hypothetical protein